MKKADFLLALILFPTLISCSCSEKKEEDTNSLTKEIAVYSGIVKDSFFITVQLPVDYYKDTSTNYPVVYVLDANFHFPILSSTIKQYELGGLLPSIILVGIGYKSFEQMDSLRVRDYMYPASLPSDEMNAVGGGKNFYDFITSQLVPYIDSNYNTEKNNRSLLGHSFGGYFSLYALLNQIENNRTIFKNFASASPSLWYNNFYLNQLTDKLSTRKNKDTLDIFITVGGLEDSIWNIEPFKKLAGNITNAKIKDIKFENKIYSDLEHMDVSSITFLKALLVFYPQD
jgi:hypothetical protein